MGKKRRYRARAEKYAAKYGLKYGLKKSQQGATIENFEETDIEPTTVMAAEPVVEEIEIVTSTEPLVEEINVKEAPIVKAVKATKAKRKPTKAKRKTVTASTAPTTKPRRKRTTRAKTTS